MLHPSEASTPHNPLQELGLVQPRIKNHPRQLLGKRISGLATEMRTSMMTRSSLGATVPGEERTSPRTERKPAPVIRTLTGISTDIQSNSGRLRSKRLPSKHFFASSLLPRVAAGLTSGSILSVAQYQSDPASCCMV